jgi:hypothetical protein
VVLEELEVEEDVDELVEEPDFEVEPEVEEVELEPKRLVVARKVEAELALPEAELEEPVALPEPEVAVDEVVEEDEAEDPPELPPPPPPPPRIPRNCGAASEANLSAEVTPVRRMDRSRVPAATTAVRTATVPEPERAGSVACFQANQPALASKATTRSAIPLLDRGRFGP